MLTFIGIKILKNFWYLFSKIFIKCSLFFYVKKISIIGRQNIPKRGAVLFAVNHPNGLLDPLIVATHNPRINHFLVRAAVFKKPIVRKLLATLNLMPIYRIRDGIKQVAKNQTIFDVCFRILKNKGAIIIFPEGTHNRKRSIRPLSKGFARIVFGALEKYPSIEIAIIPVGITYQNVSSFPSNICIRYGKPIYVTKENNTKPLTQSISILKNDVTEQLKKLSVCIDVSDDKLYNSVLTTLNKGQVDFTKVDSVNKMIEEKTFPAEKNNPKNYTKPLYYLILANSIIPYFIWKKVVVRIDEIEFIDTFRFSINLISFGFFYSIQAGIITSFFNWKAGMSYFVFSCFLVFIYTKLSPTPTE